MIKTKTEAKQLLQTLGASKRLLVHHQLVGEAAEELLDSLASLDLNIQNDLVRLGASIHDAGKILCPGELTMPGNQHEPVGEQMLLEAGVQPEIARCCLSHARYESMEVCLEELLVALSDKLWKGKRVATLELRVIDEIAEVMGKNRWDIYLYLDECFEKIAANGDHRLAQSMNP
ncbi:HD domain-containing protein [Acaryochloris marina]|uniref:HD domain-containing protein n=1 Tax=Acaryochloris marina (strain MBIC 11017) TaxID=329726 RepID=B0C0W0_ACAM1|nr:HD domain-containing protein [Acaryochloris marina]ABW27219.1 hypothetical protein AM1_2206 [Acaryochloris marina MBIC11017]BDM81970.1 hypothetical protein AM10699_48340 [Acaryochloris marina MBIC10699]